MPETWRLLTTWDGEPGFNMALDEALFLHGGSHPTLRFYTWKPTALSLGYFQKIASVPQGQRAALCVRRLTGGGAIYHSDELTFSISAPLEHPLYRGEVKGSYERIHAALAQAFAEFDVDAKMRGESSLSSDSEDSVMCFHHSTPLDLVWGARKGVGSAQRRSSGRVLHHGSIKFKATPFEPGVAGLHEHVPELAPAELALCIQRHFAERFCLAFTPTEIQPGEASHVRERAPFFTSEEFVASR
ncbi:MAG: hypothetical protein CMJ89_06915 [Planctomycetes bacterium]|jgi:lipoate-protein ligase A|nr:hypothetical protein [Planctomycetota bacterium]